MQPFPAWPAAGITGHTLPGRSFVQTRVPSSRLAATLARREVAKTSQCKWELSLQSGEKGAANW